VGWFGRAGAVVCVGAEVRPTRVEEVDPLLDALERLDDVALESDQDVDGVLVGAPADLLRDLLRFGDDPAALGFGLLGEAALVNEEGGLLLGARDDSLGLLLGLVDDSFTLGVDPLRCADLLGDGNAQLVDQAEGGRLIDDDVVRQGKVPAVRDDRLEAFDEKDDVDRSALRLAVDRDGGSFAGLSHGPAAAERGSWEAGPGPPDGRHALACFLRPSNHRMVHAAAPAGADCSFSHTLSGRAIDAEANLPLADSAAGHQPVSCRGHTRARSGRGMRRGAPDAPPGSV
jgi:hypothetical protein